MRACDIVTREQIDLEAARTLSDLDLKELGLPLGPRSKLRAAIQTLQSAVRSSDTSPASEPLAAPNAQRRQLTVMFCDLVGSTELSSRLDPEDLREVVREYQSSSATVIARFEGHIAQYLGDGLLVYFGHPQAHEDDAQRAVRAGLGILDSLKALNAKLHTSHSVSLSVRIGIHTGLVVVGEIGGGERRENLALGETPNVAARLQGFASPDTIVISAATHRLVQRLFALRDLGAHALKGVPDAVRSYRVLSEADASSRLEMPGELLTPLVGRNQEVGLLLDRWEQAADSAGQVVVLTGEPGIGKSRLLAVLRERIAGRTHTRLDVRCSSYYKVQGQSALSSDRSSSPRPCLARGRFRDPKIGKDRSATPEPRFGRGEHRAPRVPLIVAGR